MNFTQTLQLYRQRWDELDAAGIVGFFAADYQGSYAHTLNQVDTNVLETALAGWQGAFDQFQHIPCRWEFEDLAIRRLGVNGMLVAGWLRLHLNGQLAGETYRMEVWREEGGAWRLLRDHQEYNVMPPGGDGV